MDEISGSASLRGVCKICKEKYQHEPKYEKRVERKTL
jgi:hypothetical protein